MDSVPQVPAPALALPGTTGPLIPPEGPCSLENCPLETIPIKQSNTHVWFDSVFQFSFP